MFSLNKVAKYFPKTFMRDKRTLGSLKLKFDNEDHKKWSSMCSAFENLIGT